MLFLYLLLMLSIGINFYVLIKHFKLVDDKKLNIFEIISIIITSGLILFTLYMFILGIIGIKLNWYIFIPIIACSLFSFIYLIKATIDYFKRKEKFRFKFEKKNILNILIYSILIFANLNLLFYFATKGASTKLVYPDEFSVWGLNAKNIFLGQKLTLFMNTGLENYPNFLPLLYSGLYIFIGKIQENIARVFSSIFLLINLINMFGLAKRLKLDYRYLLLGNLFILTYFSESTAFAGSLYSDYAFMAMYTMAIEYLFIYLLSIRSEGRKEFLFISILNMIGACWCRQEGLYLFAFNIFILLVTFFGYKKLNIEKFSLKEVSIYCATVLLVPIAWKIWTIVAKYPTELVFGAGSKVELHLEFVVPLFKSMTEQFFNDIPSMSLFGLLIIGIIMNYYKLQRKEKIFLLFNILTGLANFAFLVICYLFVFGGEALIAASFIRYYSKIIMINLIMVLVLIHNMGTIKT